MTISPPEREVKAVKIVVDRDPVPTSFEKWGKPGHFSRTLAKVLQQQHGYGISMLMHTILTATQQTLKIFHVRFSVRTLVNLV